MILGVLDRKTGDLHDVFFLFPFWSMKPLVHLISQLVSVAQKLKSVVWERQNISETTWWIPMISGVLDRKTGDLHDVFFLFPFWSMKPSGSPHFPSGLRFRESRILDGFIGNS